MLKLRVNQREIILSKLKSSSSSHVLRLASASRSVEREETDAKLRELDENIAGRKAEIEEMKRVELLRLAHDYKSPKSVFKRLEVPVKKMLLVLFGNLNGEITFYKTARSSKRKF